MARDGNWARVKEIVGWLIYTLWGNLALYSKQQLEIFYLLKIPTTQRRISVKKLERLIGKLGYMHLSVPGSIGHFYAMQVALSRA